MRHLQWTLWLGILALVGCQSLPAAKPLAARMLVEKTTPACIAQIENAAQVPGGPKVHLTSAVFAKDDRLSLVLGPSVDAAGLNANGALLNKPQSFWLTLDQGRCMMRSDATGKSVELTACTCVVLP
jgi:hypothetical protein